MDKLYEANSNREESKVLKHHVKRILEAVLPKSGFRHIKGIYYLFKYGTADYKKRFERIYRDNIWEGAESRSGPGSAIGITEIIRGELARWTAEHRIATFVDVPCGDFNWMRYVEFPNELKYTGIDIVKDLIAANNARFSGEKCRFIYGDILTSDLPEADVYFCKDIFIHFPNESIVNATARVLRKCRYLLASTYPNTRSNEDVAFGDARRVNLELLLGPPIEMLKDFGGDSNDRYIGVWKGGCA